MDINYDGMFALENGGIEGRGTIESSTGKYDVAVRQEKDSDSVEVILSGEETVRAMLNNEPYIDRGALVVTTRLPTVPEDQYEFEAYTRWITRHGLQRDLRYIE